MTLKESQILERVKEMHYCMIDEVEILEQLTSPDARKEFNRIVSRIYHLEEARCGMI